MFYTYFHHNSLIISRLKIELKGERVKRGIFRGGENRELTLDNWESTIISSCMIMQKNNGRSLESKGVCPLVRADVSARVSDETVGNLSKDRREMCIGSKGDLYRIKGSFVSDEREICLTSKGDNFIKTLKKKSVSIQNSEGTSPRPVHAPSKQLQLGKN
jgi:hypothetical protein